MQLVEAAVPAHALVQVGLAAAVVAQHTQHFIVCLFLRRDQSGVAGGAKILGRIERKAAEIAPAAGAPAVVVGAERLGAVLHQKKILFPANL